MFIKTRLLFVFLGLTLLIFGLAGCTSAPTSGIKIQNVSIEPDPIVGQPAVVTLEISSNYNHPGSELMVQFGGGRAERDPIIVWQGELKKDELQEVQFQICASYPELWTLIIGVTTPSNLGDGTMLQIETNYESSTIYYGGKPQEEISEAIGDVTTYHEIGEDGQITLVPLTAPALPTLEPTSIPLDPNCPAIQP